MKNNKRKSFAFIMTLVLVLSMTTSIFAGTTVTLGTGWVMSTETQPGDDGADLSGADSYNNFGEGENFNYDYLDENGEKEDGELTAEVVVELEGETYDASRTYEPGDTAHMSFVINHVEGKGDTYDGSDGIYDLIFKVTTSGGIVYKTPNDEAFDVAPGTSSPAVEVDFDIPADAQKGDTYTFFYTLEDWGSFPNQSSNEATDWMFAKTVTGQVVITVDFEEEIDYELIVNVSPVGMGTVEVDGSFEVPDYVIGSIDDATSSSAIYDLGDEYIKDWNITLSAIESEPTYEYVQYLVEYYGYGPEDSDDYDQLKWRFYGYYPDKVISDVVTAPYELYDAQTVSVTAFFAEKEVEEEYQLIVMVDPSNKGKVQIDGDFWGKQVAESTTDAGIIDDSTKTEWTYDFENDYEAKYWNITFSAIETNTNYDYLRFKVEYYGDGDSGEGEDWVLGWYTAGTYSQEVISEEAMSLFSGDHQAQIVKVTAYFKYDKPDDPTTKYTLDVSSTEGGSSTFDGISSHNAGTTVNLDITTEEGYVFVGWEGDTDAFDPGSLSDADETDFDVVMNSDVTLHAVFEPEVVEYTLTVTSTDGGSSTNEGVEVLPAGELVDLDITTEAGFYFVGWEGDDAGLLDPDTYEVTMDQDVTVHAVFEKIEVFDDEDTPESSPVILNEEVPEGPAENPQTSGIPAEAFGLLGTFLGGVGVVLKKRK